MNVEQFVNQVTNNAKTKQWLSCTESVERADGQCFAVGIKAYGKWVQRIECGSYVDGIAEQKTIKALKEQLTALVTQLLNLQ